MSRSSGREGQAEPTAALAAVFAVVVGLGLYAGALGQAMPGPGDRNHADPAVEQAFDRLSGHGQVVDPGRVSAAAAAGPDGYRTNVTVRVAGERWSAGPETPATGADRASRSVGVRRAPGHVDAGTLRVVVWG